MSLSSYINLENKLENTLRCNAEKAIVINMMH